MAKEKNCGFYFKMSEKEKARIKQKMEMVGIRNMSAFIRKMCIDGYAINLNLPELKECSRYLSSASNNMNQIARAVNSGLGYTPKEILDVKDSLDACTDVFGKLLDELARIA